ncbi:MAG TPA: N-6 DNA methylase [Paludibacter sp.]
MKTNSFYSTLGYDEFLRNNSEISTLYPDYKEIELLGADKVYFSGNNPAVLFVEVSAFEDAALRRIADIQHKAWNYRKILLLFALSDTEIRIYNCQEKPSYISKTVTVSDELNKIQIFDYNERSDKKALDVLSEVFSRIGVDCGLLWTTDYEVRKKVNIQRRLDKYLVQSLMHTASALESKGITERSIIHGLLMRSLFILFLEDKGAAQKAGLYENIKKGANCYFDILEDIDATYQLYNQVQEHFNGNVFPVLPNERQMVQPEHLKLIRKCFTDGDLSNDPKLFNDWKLFNFEIIQIELLSEIYENFLGEFKREKGQFYTPYSLVELILKDKLPTNEVNFNTKILDPACGSGIFLVESYKRLIKRWKYANPTQKIGFEELQRLLLENIYGIEIDPTAIKVATFSLYLALVDELDPKTLWIEKGYQLPNLIFDPDDLAIKKQGNNLWRRDTIGEVNTEEFVRVDLVVGNPPFGTKKLAEKSKSIYDYCKDHDFGKEMVLPFMHKAVSFCPNGQIALVFNTKVLTNTEVPFQNFRKWLLQENYVEKVYNLSIFRKAPKNFGGQLFTSAVGPVSIAYYQRKTPKEQKETIEYWAPKTYIKANLVEGVIIDSSDIKFLPRVECQKPDTKIWKIAMWGGIQDFKLIERFRNVTLIDYFKQNSIIYGVGLELSSPKDKKNLDIYKLPHITPNNIQPFYQQVEDTLTIKDTMFRRLGKTQAYIAPHILINEGIQKNKLTISLLDYDCSYYKGIVGIISKEKDFQKLKLIAAFLNSIFVRYYAFLSTSTWGIERDTVKHKELFLVPSLLTGLDLEIQSKIISLFDEIQFLSKQSMVQNITDIENSINNLFLSTLNSKERFLINDRLSIAFSQFTEGPKSIAFHQTLETENKAYAETLCYELNAFLLHSKLKVNASIYDVGLRDPLNLVVLHFGEVEKTIETKDLANLRENLFNVDRYMLHPKAGDNKENSIYVQKQVRYFDNDTVYLIKPNQKRFWTRSQAIDDATSLISEIINMESK